MYIYNYFPEMFCWAWSILPAELLWLLAASYFEAIVYYGYVVRHDFKWMDVLVGEGASDLNAKRNWYPLLIVRPWVNLARAVHKLVRKETCTCGLCTGLNK